MEPKALLKHLAINLMFLGILLVISAPLCSPQREIIYVPLQSQMEINASQKTPIEILLKFDKPEPITIGGKRQPEVITIEKNEPKVIRIPVDNGTYYRMEVRVSDAFPEEISAGRQNITSYESWSYTPENTLSDNRIFDNWSLLVIMLSGILGFCFYDLFLNVIPRSLLRLG